jgi:hypothetical protein
MYVHEANNHPLGENLDTLIVIDIPAHECPYNSLMPPTVTSSSEIFESFSTTTTTTTDLRLGEMMTSITTYI